MSELTKVFKSQDLRDQELPWETPEGGEIISDEIIDHSRWSVIHWLIVRFADDPEGTAWGVSYSVGATESQDEQPWEYEDEVTFYKLALVEKITKVWEQIKE